MKPRYYYDERTGRAWESLSGRHKRDGLLPEKEDRKGFRFTYISAWAAALLIISFLAIFAVRSFRDLPADTITITNNQGNSAFVATLQDGSTVYLSRGSSITYPRKFIKGIREVSLKGEAYFQVSPDKNHPFVVQADLINIEVLGTSFRISGAVGNEQTISVESGRVMVTLKSNGETSTTEAGETVLVRGEEMEKSLTADVRQFGRFLERMRFKDARLSDVAAIINRNFEGGEIVVDPSVKDRLLTATFSDKTPESMARLITLAMDLSYRREGEKIIIF